jgi:hypothetical protein
MALGKSSNSSVPALNKTPNRPVTVKPWDNAVSLGLYGQRWIYAMELWANWALQLIALKPHKQLYFQRVFYALSLMQQAL